MNFVVGALSGQIPDQALGLPPAAGWSLFDDFFSQDWSVADIVTAPTVTYPTPSAATEGGLIRVATGGSSGDGAVIYKSGQFYAGCLPVGTIWAVKLRMSTGTADYELWSGFTDGPTNLPSSASTDGIHIYSTGGNLFGRVSDGNTESTVDLGVDCESAFRIVGFEVLGGPAVQFFILTLSDRRVWQRYDVGDAITTPLPNEALQPIALGIKQTSASGVAATIDFWSLGGRVAR